VIFGISHYRRITGPGSGTFAVDTPIGSVIDVFAASAVRVLKVDIVRAGLPGADTTWLSRWCKRVQFLPEGDKRIDGRWATVAKARR
jgi:hypothetical protein